MSPVSAQLDAICDAFEKALIAGHAPNVTEFIANADLDSRGQLIRLLLEIEQEHVLRNGGRVVERNLYAAYPQYRREVSQALAAVKKRMATGQTSNSSPLEGDQKNRVVLRVIAGPLAGHEFPFTSHQTLVAGRSRNAQLKLSADRRLSRFHCRFEIRPPECVVLDLGSRNGTLLNGVNVTTATLCSGDQVQIGDTSIQVEISTVNANAAGV